MGAVMFTDDQDYIAEIESGSGNSLCRRLVGEEQLWLKACRQGVRDARLDWLAAASKEGADGSRAIQVIRRWHDSQTIDCRRDAPSIAQELAKVACFTANLRNLILHHQASGRPFEADAARALATELYNSVHGMERIEGTGGETNPLKAEEFARTAKHIRRWRGEPSTHAEAMLSALQSFESRRHVKRSRDLILYFLGEDLYRDSRQVRVNGLLDMPIESKGQVVTLGLQLGRPGEGTIYPDAQRMLFFSFDDPFKRALRKGWAYATARFGRMHDVRWYLSLRRSTSEDEHLPFQIEGGSMGAAFALGLTHLLDHKRDPIDHNWAITGSITRGGRIKQVTGQFAKLAAVRKADLKAIIPSQSTTHPRTGREITPKSWGKTVANESINQDLATWAQRIRLETARTVDQASEIATEKMGEVIGYLELLQANLSVLPRYYPKNFDFDFARIRQKVCVSTERLRSKKVETRFAESRDVVARGAESFTSEEVLDWDDVGRRLERGVILGDAGFGKTWLLKYEGWRVAGEQLAMLRRGEIGVDDAELPIYMRLGDLAGEASRDSGDAVTAVLNTLSRSYALAPELVKQSLENGKALLLLDALDEVPSGPRERLMNVLEYLTSLRCRMLVSSRIDGYRSVFRLRHDESQREVEVVAFESEQIGLFISAWFRSLKYLDSKCESDPSLTTAEKSAGKLYDLLRDNPSLLALARIPLLLTFICLLASEPDTLSSRRADLYNEILGRLLQGAWRDKSDPNIERREKKLEVLREVAWHFAGGRNEGKWSDLMSGTELAQVIAKVPRWIDLRRDGDPLDLTGLEILSERDGVLVRAGDAQYPGGELNVPYLFLHRTFHEFLVADFLAKQSAKKWLIVVRKHCWDRDWDDVIVLLAGLLKSEGVMLLLRTLLDQKNDAFNTMLLLAGRCLGEVKQAELSGISIADEVNNRLEALLSSDNAHDRDQASRVLSRTRVIGRLEDSWLLVSKEHDQLPSSDIETRLKAEDRDEVTTRDRETLDDLLDRLRWGNYKTRRSVVKELVKKGDARATSTLLTLLRDEDRLVRILACEALGDLRELRSVNPLIQLLIDRDYVIQATAASSLGKIGDLRAGEPLIGLLARNRNSVRQAAIRALGVLADPQAEAALVQILVDSNKKPGLRAEAARALGSLGGATAVDALFEGITERRYPGIRRASVESLGNLGDPRAIEGLVSLLCDDDRDVSAAAGEALKSLANELRKAEGIYDAAVARLKQAPRKYFKDMRCRENVYHLLARIAPLVSAANKAKWPERRERYVSAAVQSYGE